MVAFIVLPCLNEELSLGRTCQSLGFGGGARRSTSTLVIVDNGSTDGTLDVAAHIQATSKEGSVAICHESTRGFVPARSAGVRMVESIAIERGISPEEVLILQVDADAVYSDNYSEALSAASEQAGPGVLLEGIVTMPFDASGADMALLERIGRFDEDILSENAHLLDCVVDDKVAAYRLTDYRRVGGLQREFIRGHEYIYCGTSRMWTRMIGVGMSRVAVPDAVCSHSLRKIAEGADIFVATAGWPRERAWKEAWRKIYPEPIDSAELLASSNHGLMEAALESRAKHLEAIFFIMPQLLSKLIKNDSSYSAAGLLDMAFSRVGSPFIFAE